MFMPNATARCVLPTPSGPSSSTFSPSVINRLVVNSLITLGSIDSWETQPLGVCREAFELGRRHRATSSAIAP
jgi:hypothetical protein